MANELYLRDEFHQAWAGQDPFAEIQNLTGKVYRELEARRTLRFQFSGRSYFIKIHFGVGWYEIIENLIRLRLPVLGARNEYQAILKCQQIGVKTMSIAGFGMRGSNPATQHSFIITDDLINTISLEDLSANWKEKKPNWKLKFQLLKQLADISHKLHHNGINHRDYYICHFLLDISHGIESIDVENLHIFLIDLHRSQIRNKVPERWLVKDLGSLYYSAMNIGLNRHDFLRFIKQYSNASLKTIFQTQGQFWEKVAQQGERLMRRKMRKGDAL